MTGQFKIKIIIHVCRACYHHFYVNFYQTIKFNLRNLKNKFNIEKYLAIFGPTSMSLTNSRQILFATASYDRTIRFWEWSGACYRVFQHNESVNIPYSDAF